MCRAFLKWATLLTLAAASLSGSKVALSILVVYLLYPYRGMLVRAHSTLIANLEGPPGAGKTWALQKLDWRAIFNRAVNIVDESIPDGVMADFYDADKQSVVAYTFEHFTVAMRQAIDWRCRADTSRTHIRDRTLISSHVFHIVGHTLGTLTTAQADELLSLKVVENTLLPGHAVVYFGTPFAICNERVVARKGSDAGIDPRYHALTVFVHAYVIAQLVATQPDVLFLDGTTLKPGYDAKVHRARVLASARANLTCELSPAELKRFNRIAGPLDGLRWELAAGAYRAKVHNE